MRLFSSVPERLVDGELQNAVKEIPTWKLDTSTRDVIKKDFVFQNFSEAWSFMSRTALYAEQQNHHPEWFNVYNRVSVALTTHDCSGVSQKDIDMAKTMDSYASTLL